MMFLVLMKMRRRADGFVFLMLCHPFLALPSHRKPKQLMHETIAHTVSLLKNGRTVKLFNRKVCCIRPWNALLLDLLHELCFCTPCSDCWLIVDLNQLLLIHRTEVSWTKSSASLSDRSGKERLSACHDHSCRGQTTAETPLVLGENNANLITAS